MPDEVPGTVRNTATVERAGQGAEALHRDMPFTRLVDCGMDHADARELLDRTLHGQPWHVVARELGERQAHRRDQATARGFRATALDAARYAIAAFTFAQMAHDRDTAHKTDDYERLDAAIAELVALRPAEIREFTTPYKHGELNGWLLTPRHAEPVATVIVWGGLSGWGMAYLPVAEALVDRGLACLLVEGPGQGRSRLKHRLYGSRESIGGFGTFVDVATEALGLPGRIGILGNSFGGLIAAHVTARDKRVAACVINCGPAVISVPSGPSAREQLGAFLGTDDINRMDQELTQLQFPPEPGEETAQIRVPCLVLNGGQDPLAPSIAQEPFLAQATHPASRLQTWPDGQHNLYNHAAERNALVGDWFLTHLTTPTASTHR